MTGPGAGLDPASVGKGVATVVFLDETIDGGVAAYRLLSGRVVEPCGESHAGVHVEEERVGIHLVDIHSEGVGTIDGAVEVCQTQRDAPGEVDGVAGVLTVVVHRALAGLGVLDHNLNLTHRRRDGEHGDELIYGSSHRQRVGVVDDSMVEVDGEIDRVEVRHHLIVGLKVELGHNQLSTAVVRLVKRVGTGVARRQ